MLKIFGRGYEEIGSSDKGLILKNSGKVKVQWGNKYIDLLDSNGNINAKAQQLIKEISSESELKQNGFYFYDGKLIAKIGENVIQLSSESGNTYVSFLEEQETSEEEKYKALQNIGFVYSTIDIDNVYPTNGIVYIESEESFYIVKDGELLKKLDITSSSSSEEESSESSEIPIPERTRAVEEDDDTTDYTSVINGLIEQLSGLSEKIQGLENLDLEGLKTKVQTLEDKVSSLENRGAILGCINQEEEGEGNDEEETPNQDSGNQSEGN